MAEDVCWSMMPVHQLADLLRQGIEKRLIIDSRSFLEFNTCHISESVNVSSSKLIKRRLQQDKLSVRELLTANCQVDMDVDYDIIVYDQCTSNPSLLSVDCFLVILVMKLQKEFRNVFLLKGGFLEFQATHPGLCNNQGCSSSSGKCPPLTSMSQPCMPVSNVGPTKILPFLFLGSQQDALSQETMKQNGINYILNVSTTSPQPSFVQEGHFLRIPVNDSYCDKLIPHFEEAFLFIDKVREANECVLVHCLAGISRSPSLAIAYIMKYLRLTTDEAYKYVKDKRPTISPNFNFLGQLLEYEKLLHNANNRSTESADVADDVIYAKKQCIVDLLSPASPSVSRGKTCFAQKQPYTLRPMSLHSPTAALSKLNFNHPSPVIEVPSPMESPAQSNSDDVQLSLDSVVQLPTALLDQISFTPCFARVESADSYRFVTSFDGGFDSFSDSSNVAPRRDVPMLPSSADVTSEQWLKSEAATEMNCSPNLKRGKAFSDVSAGSLKVMRSQDNHAKRHLARPNSIAFSSSYARRESLAKNNNHTKESCISNVKVKDGGAQIVDGTVVDLEELCSPSKSPMKLVNGDHDTRQNLGQYHKSRSLEDILISPDEQDSDVLNHLKDLDHGCLPSTVEMLSPTNETALCRWHGSADHNPASGNVSPSSSQNSVHDGLEVIEVI